MSGYWSERWRSGVSTSTSRPVADFNTCARTADRRSCEDYATTAESRALRPGISLRITPSWAYLRRIAHQSSVKHIERGAVIELFCVSSIGSQSPSSPHPGRAFCYSPLHRVHWNQH